MAVSFQAVHHPANPLQENSYNITSSVYLQCGHCIIVVRIEEMTETAVTTDVQEKELLPVHIGDLRPLLYCWLGPEGMH